MVYKGSSRNCLGAALVNFLLEIDVWMVTDNPLGPLIMGYIGRTTRDSNCSKIKPAISKSFSMGNSSRKPEKTSENQEEEDNQSSFTCEICIEPSPPSKKFKNTNTCIHPFCQECIAKYIEVKVEDKTAKIQCPEPSCPNHLDPLTCRPMISPTLFSSWCDQLCENCLLGSERSYCPNRSCRSLVLNECGGNVKKCKCPNCKQLFCFQCQSVWHPGFWCEEREQIRDRNDLLFGLLVERKKWRRCPGCLQCVERRVGCSTVTCRCKTKFCYQCGEKFTSSGSCGCKLIISSPSFCLFIYVVLVIVLVAFLLLHTPQKEKAP